jgi:hypothetical protein
MLPQGTWSLRSPRETTGRGTLKLKVKHYQRKTYIPVIVGNEI